jgi:arginine/lysine/ornithine decarboxylase
MASLDRAVTHLAKEDLFTPYVKNLNRLYAAAEEFKHLSLFRCADFDMGKIVIFCGDSNISGFELKTTLREKYKIQLEMAMPQYALAMTSVADTHEGFDRLISALREIDSTLTPCKNPPLLFPPKACAKLPIFTKGKETYITPENAVNKISAEFIYAYPPGSPIVAPGEVITKDILDYLWSLCSAGAQICSSKGKYPNEIAVFQ